MSSRLLAERENGEFAGGSEPFPSGSAARSSARPIGEPEAVPDTHALGQPLDIKKVARLIGCSAWTVRQTLIPAGLPHFRSGRRGRLLFYQQQIVRWILRRQRLQGGRM